MNVSDSQKKFVIIVSGPTGVGKSKIAEHLGDSMPIEIINADIGSFYSSMTIGTAKPAWQNSAIPHHFFDVIHDTSSWTAPQFREKLELLIEEIFTRGAIPVVVGGSAFYIKAFFYKNHILSTPDPLLIHSLESHCAADLWAMLYDIDPERAAQIDANDQYRLVRALAIWHTQGEKPSEFKQIFNPIAPFYFVLCSRDRKELYEMIDQRVTSMIEAGWLDEVRSLITDEQWVDFLIKKKIIGYDLLTQYLLGHHPDTDFNEIINLIAQKTRNYAKRQITFLKKLVTDIQKDQKNSINNAIKVSMVEESNLTLSDLSLYIKQLSQRILQFL